MAINDPTDPLDLNFPNQNVNVTPPLIDHTAVLRYLYAHGHFHQADQQNFRVEPKAWQSVVDLEPTHVDVQAAVRSWQSFRPTLLQDGYFGPRCHARAAEETGLRCGLPDIMQRVDRPAAWPADCKHNLTTQHALDNLTYLPDTEQTINQAWNHGLQLWNKAADLTLTHEPARRDVRIRAHARRLGRNILAWSELAYPDCSAVLDQAYNTQVRWHWHLLWSTICHEIGHALGLGHGGRGIMQPAHDPNVHKLGLWDINQVTDRYGPAIEPPTPPIPEDLPVHHAVLELFTEQGLSLARYEIKPSE